MVNYYEQFVKPKEIIKDINYFYDRIKDLICNDLFSKYYYNTRKKENNTFTIKNYLSDCDKTRLKFNNDTIIVNFRVDKKDTSKVSITNPIYKNFKIDGITINIDIALSPVENKNKIIFPENSIFRDIRKNINSINEYYVKKLRKSEEEKFKVIYGRIIKLEPSYYKDWNRLISLIKECVNPEFNNVLCMFKPIISGMNMGLPTAFKMIHKTQFFQNYEHLRQIKYTKFIRSLRKECLDDNEIIEMTNKLAWCFGHVNKDYEECLYFILNVSKHFNTICYVKEMKINSFTSDIWENGQ